MTAGETGPGGVQQWGHTSVLAVTTCPAQHQVGSSPEEAQTQLSAGIEKWRWGHSIFFEEAGMELVFTSEVFWIIPQGWNSSECKATLLLEVNGVQRNSQPRAIPSDKIQKDSQLTELDHKE